MAAPRQNRTTASNRTDNSKTNKRDRIRVHNSGPAEDESYGPRLAKRIRSAIVDDKSLSTYAHNIKIIAQDGKVT